MDTLPELTPENYINRELSWIDFNCRVLAQANDETIPLLERIKFLAIVSSNTDEFFMVRVAMVHQRFKLGLPTTRPDGVSYGVLMEQIRERIAEMMRQQRILMQDLLARLADYGVVITTVQNLDPMWQQAVHDYFVEEVFPVLTPLAVDHAHPFPFISNLSLNLAVSLKREDERNGDTEFVRLKIPDMIPRLVKVNDVLRKYGHGLKPEGDTFVWLEDVITQHLHLLFPGMKVLDYSPFRVTRNADIDYEHEQETPETDMSQVIAESLSKRRFGSVVRLAVPEGINKQTLKRLSDHLGIDSKHDVYLVNGALGGSSLMELMAVDRPELKYPTYLPRLSDDLNGDESIFAAIRKRDYLVHHPYDSFLPVETFFQSAARDPNVLAIKATLYRVGHNSPIVRALMDAREHDKQVAVVVELKARFDEENNLEWARALDEKGVHVTYGVEELPVKTHAKIALVVRRDSDGVRRYVHLSTGNYNSSTARLYSDLGLFTCNKEIADDASRLFNRLTGYAPATSYQRLLVAPEYLLPGMVDLIDGEIAAARKGKKARMILKMNQLEEDLIIQKLYEASIAGVQVDLLVRGLCCLRPGVPGLSENIRVISIVGRYLEHARIFYFQNAPAERRVYMGSADMMRRNLHNRVEVVFPILDPKIQQQSLRILATELRDNQDAWELNSDGGYTRIQTGENDPPLRSQWVFMEDSFGLDDLP
ncbi:MAG TPA: polyphosphate kinase 1 [Phototrophicaceae bacterium]|nr:polyphosphate kinase 1 [Phototrophicaceae bacterium]